MFDGTRDAKKRDAVEKNIEFIEIYRSDINQI
jgi:hypothetical protein